MSRHSDNQLHGKTFENMIKAANNGIFSSFSSDRKRSPHERFDIGREDDLERGIPTSIKSTGNNIIGLSDARSFWESFRFMPYRMIVGAYRQKGNRKVFDLIYEIIFHSKYRSHVLGDVSEDDITQFHNRLRQFGPGPDAQKQASAWAQERKQLLEERIGLVTLNPKIDSKNQRRLQCSIHLDYLIKLLEPDDYTPPQRTFRNSSAPSPDTQWLAQIQLRLLDSRPSSQVSNFHEDNQVWYGWLACRSGGRFHLRQFGTSRAGDGGCLEMPANRWYSEKGNCRI